MAEWLRRQIRTPFDYLFPFGSAGSNPAGVVSFSTLVLYWVRHVVHTYRLRPWLDLHIKSTREEKPFCHPNEYYITRFARFKMLMSP